MKTKLFFAQFIFMLERDTQYFEDNIKFYGCIIKKKYNKRTQLWYYDCVFEYEDKGINCIIDLLQEGAFVVATKQKVKVGDYDRFRNRKKC